MRVATERAKLVRGITASFKKLSKSSEVSLACRALPDMMLHCSEFHCSEIHCSEFHCSNFIAVNVIASNFIAVNFIAVNFIAVTKQH